METAAPDRAEATWRERLSQFFHRPVRALAVDLFRVLTGLLVSVYFVRLIREFPLYTAENGLLDHVLHREFFWFSKMSLIFPGSPTWYKAGILVLGLLGAVMLTVGYKPRLGAAMAWVFGVSIQRWNFAVINIDDSSIVLLLWWMLFLPIGRTLTWRTRSREQLRTEAGILVDGFMLRAFFINLFIYYLTAGLTKLWSPLWREGLALFVVLQLPLARTHGWWDMEHLPMLWIGNHLTLILEPLFPFMVLLPKGHPVKYFGGFALFVFHLAIPITIGVPYANFALILTLCLIFHREIADFCERRWQPPEVKLAEDSAPTKGARRVIAGYLLVLALAMSKGIPLVEKTYEPAMGALYWGGVAQEYHLFDWIDRFNWYVSHTVTVFPQQGKPYEVEPSQVFPASVRGFIVQSYLLPMRWMRITRPLTGEMRISILHRCCERFIRAHSTQFQGDGRVEIKTRVGRVDRDNLLIEKTWPITLVRFDYSEGAVSRYEYPRPPVQEAILGE